jgi:hypothetical protein
MRPAESDSNPRVEAASGTGSLALSVNEREYEVREPSVVLAKMTLMIGGSGISPFP